MPPNQLDLTAANILELAKTYSFYPMDRAAGYTSHNETALKGDFKGFRHTIVSQDKDGKEQRVARIAVERPQVPLMYRGADYLVSPSLTAAAGTPAYFLPWDNRGAIVEMTIPPFADGGDEAANPPIFFTAVLSGCTIMFKGTPAKPTVFHCGTGGSDGGGTPTSGDPNQFFRRMLRDVRSKGLGRSNYAVANQILSTDYMDRGAAPGLAKGEQDKFKARLESHYRGTLLIEAVTMWGIVFGVRTGVNWAFYLQENATIIYRDMADVAQYIELLKQAVADQGKAKSMQFNLSQAISDQTVSNKAGSDVKTCCRPAVVSRIFPGGAGHASVANRWRTLRT
jgi:hypothetical protein